ncbi:MAG: DHH family phosphoesterase [Bacteroidales bacterium]|nr:DHH family phosphoesterase [Bacteroidales bacterium]
MQAFNPDDIHAFSALLDRSARVVLITHTHPDGDALGSSTGMQRFLSSLDKESTVIIPDPIPETLTFIRRNDNLPLIAASVQMERAEEAISAADLIICLDLNHIRRAEGLEPAFRASGAKKVLIDHHIGPDSESFDLVFSFPPMSSASELTFWLLLALEQTGGEIEKIPLKALEALMTGMTTDTNNFGNSTSPLTLEMAGRCIAAGVDRDAILSEIYQQYRQERFAFMGYYLSGKMRITSKGVAYAVFSAEELSRFGIQDGDTEGFVNIPLGMAKVRMSFFLKEQDGSYRVSIRSKKGTSANMCARLHFNGGGHENAAGGKLPVSEFGDAAAVEAYIEKVTDGFLK